MPAVGIGDEAFETLRQEAFQMISDKLRPIIDESVPVLVVWLSVF